MAHSPVRSTECRTASRWCCLCRLDHPGAKSYFIGKSAEPNGLVRPEPDIATDTISTDPQMNLFRVALCVLSALAFLDGCAVRFPGSVAYRISQAGDGTQYEFACRASSSGNCYVQISQPEGKTSLEIVPAGVTRTLQYAVVGASFCVSSDDAFGLACTVTRTKFGPAFSVVSVSGT